MDPSLNDNRHKIRHFVTPILIVVVFNPFEEQLSRQDDIRETWKIIVRWAEVWIVHDNFPFDMSTFTRLFV
jgi:hypothetical protein